jgi:VLRF1 release factor-like protein
VDVAPERLDRWLENFAGRHGPWSADHLLLTAEDGATAELSPPPGVPDLADLDDLRREAGEPRRIGLLLARKGAVAVGVAVGPKLLVSKVDTHYVQGRTAAGGWSQQRFARRRDNQAKAAAADGAGIAARLLLPEVRTLATLVTGGDHTAVDTILATPQLRPLAPLRSDRFLEVPEPRRTVLEEAITQARALRILIRDPTPK